MYQIFRKSTGPDANNAKNRNKAITVQTAVLHTGFNQGCLRASSAVHLTAGSHSRHFFKKSINWGSSVWSLEARSLLPIRLFLLDVWGRMELVMQSVLLSRLADMCPNLRKLITSSTRQIITLRRSRTLGIMCTCSFGQ